MGKQREAKQVFHDKYGEGVITADENGRFTRTTEGGHDVYDVVFSGETQPRAILTSYLRTQAAEKRAA